MTFRYTPTVVAPTGFVGPQTHGCSEDTERVPPASKNKKKLIKFKRFSMTGESNLLCFRHHQFTTSVWKDAINWHQERYFYCFIFSCSSKKLKH